VEYGAVSAELLPLVSLGTTHAGSCWCSYNGEQPKYFMLNLVYAAGVIETPSRITRPGVEIRGAPLKVRSETQYLQAYLSLSTPYTPPYLLASSVLTLRVSAPPSTTTECFSFSELKVRIIQAILAALAKFPSYLIRGIDILACAMRNYYVFTVFFLTFLQLFYVFLWLLFLIDGRFNILVF